MKYGMNLFLWTDQLNDTVIPVLERLKEMGYDGVEVPVNSFDVDEYVRWGKILDDIGLERTACTVRGAHENIISSDRNIREIGIAHNKRAIDCCKAVGAKMMVGPYHSGLGVFTGTGPTKDEWHRGVEAMQGVSEYAETRGVTLGLEFLNRFECYFLNCTQDTVQFVRDVNHPNCKMMYDTFHASIEEKSISKSIRAASEVLCHVHIAENDRGTPGEGNVRWDEVFSSLIDVNYDGWLTVEAFGMTLPSLAAATKIWRRMYQDEDQLARDGLAFMRYQWEDNPKLRREPLGR